jgi:ATP-dependent DNA ligase
MALPRVQPIKPTWRKEPFDASDWLFDVKYDGFRALCYIEQGRCRVVSRNGNAMSRFDALGDQMAAVLDVDDAIIDGVTAIRRLQPFRYLHDCSDCFRRERMAGWALHPLESAALSRRTPKPDLTGALHQVSP